MRDFQDFTRETPARRGWWAWSLPAVLVALVVGGAAFALAPGGGEKRGPERLEASPAGWVSGVLGGGGVIEDGPFNVLVLGVDTRPDSEEGGSRTDTIMLVRIEPGDGDVRLLSVPRDLMVKVGPGQEDRINAAYNFGGIQQTIDAFEDYSRIKVDHFAVVDFKGFREVIDTMGGVEMDVEDEIPPKYEIRDGLQTLNGAQALFYARYRKTSGGDLDRIERQQRLVAALRSQAFEWDTVKQLPEILRVANRNTETDMGLRQGIALGKVLIERGPNAQMTAQQLQGTPTTRDNGDQVLIPDPEANAPILDQFRY